MYGLCHGLNDKEALVIEPVHPCVNPPADGALGGALVTELFQHMYVQVLRPMLPQ